MEENYAIRLCQEGDLDALGALFEAHRTAVLRTAYAIVRDRDLAEDVTQQVFIQLYRSIKRYDPSRPFAPWLHRIAANVSISELRRRKRPLVPMDEAAEFTSRQPTPHQESSDAEVRRAIWDAIGGLTPEHRAVIVLRYYRGFSEAEMAVALGCRKGTVKSRLHNALKRLGALLPEHLRESAFESDVDLSTTATIGR